jgi:hypothetical protein
MVVAATLWGCHGAAATPQVEVHERDPLDAGGFDASVADASLPDAGNISDLRGSLPVWPRGEQTLALPYGTGAVRAELTLAPNPQQLDLHFNVDTTASFGGEIMAMQRELSRTIIPALLTRVADTRIGVSRFADFPYPPFGQSADEGRADVPFALLTPVTASLARVTNALKQLNTPLDDGADIPEAGAEALYQIATGVGMTWKGTRLIAPFDATKAAADGGGSAGGVGFRAGALRVVVHITDAPSHLPQDYALLAIEPTHDLQTAAAALSALGVRVLGINSCPSTDPFYDQVRSQLSDLALATDAAVDPVHGSCATGVSGAARPPYRALCPFVFDIKPDGSGLADSIVDAVVGLLEGVRFSEVHAEIGADPLGFISRIELAAVPQAAGVPAPKTADRLPTGAPDGKADSYLDVTSRQRLGFAVILTNQRIAPSDEIQHFRSSLRLVGDGVLLEERVLAVTVAAADHDAFEQDAGDRDAGD